MFGDVVWGFRFVALLVRQIDTVRSNRRKHRVTLLFTLEWRLIVTNLSTRSTRNFDQIHLLRSGISQLDSVFLHPAGLIILIISFNFLNLFAATVVIAIRILLHLFIINFLLTLRNRVLDVSTFIDHVLTAAAPSMIALGLHGSQPFRDTVHRFFLIQLTINNPVLFINNIFKAQLELAHLTETSVKIQVQ